MVNSTITVSYKAYCMYEYWVYWFGLSNAYYLYDMFSQNCIALLLQKCGALSLALDDDFLQCLARNYEDVHDNRVAQGMASMLGRKLLIITSSLNGASSALYRPFNVNNDLPTVTLGHIEDQHFVPLQKGRVNFHINWLIGNFWQIIFCNVIYNNNVIYLAIIILISYKGNKWRS